MVQLPDFIDPETGVWNHHWVYDRANAEWNRSDRYDHTAAVIELEVDEPQSSEAVKAVAAVLRDRLRAYDLIGRKGPTTFSILACEIEPRSARRICERIKAGLVDQSAGGHQIGVAMGAVATDAERVEVVEDLFDVAWEACSRAQRGEGEDGILVLD